MSAENEFESFGKAYLKIIRDVADFGDWVDGVTDQHSIGSDFGNRVVRTKELLVYSFVVSNPRQREISVTNKTVNREYMLANFLWALLGTKAGKHIVAFNSRGKILMDEEDEFHAALGPHIFKKRNNVFHELSAIEKLLRRDPTTRRAVFQFFRTNDIKINAKDVPCYNHMQFFVRGNQLHAHVVMRSQNALMVLPYDFYFFSLFQEALSVRLGIPLGKTYYTANSMHIYEDRMPDVATIEAAGDVPAESVMQDFSDDTIARLKKLFLALARAKHENNKPLIEQLIVKNPIDAYWDGLIRSHFLGVR